MSSNRNVKASILWPRDVYLLLCKLARREGQTFSAYVKSCVAPRLREEAASCLQGRADQPPKSHELNKR